LGAAHTELVFCLSWNFCGENRKTEAVNLEIEAWFFSKRLANNMGTLVSLAFFRTVSRKHRGTKTRLFCANRPARLTGCGSCLLRNLKVDRAMIQKDALRLLHTSLVLKMR
jgi:hypothetical protein